MAKRAYVGGSLTVGPGGREGRGGARVLRVKSDEASASLEVVAGGVDQAATLELRSEQGFGTLSTKPSPTRVHASHKVPWRLRPLCWRRRLPRCFPLSVCA